MEMQGRTDSRVPLRNNSSSSSGNGNRMFSWLPKFNSNSDVSAKVIEPGLGYVVPLPDPIFGESAFENIWVAVNNENSHKIEICGVKIGNGLTTLINYLNNRFIEEKQYDHVFLCRYVACTSSIRDTIANQLGISENQSWKEETDFNVQAQMLYEALRNKSYVILLDALPGLLYLSTIGVPEPADHGQSKVIYSTITQRLQSINSPDTSLNFDVLSKEDSTSLFLEIAGLKQNTKFQHIIVEIVDMCFYIPKVLVVVAALMKRNKNLTEWQRDLKIMRRFSPELQVGQSRFKNDFAEDYYYKICFKRDIAAHKIPVIIDYWPGLGGEEGKKLLAVRQRAAK